MPLFSKFVVYKNLLESYYPPEPKEQHMQAHGRQHLLHLFDEHSPGFYTLLRRQGLWVLNCVVKWHTPSLVCVYKS